MLLEGGEWVRKKAEASGLVETIAVVWVRDEVTSNRTVLVGRREERGLWVSSVGAIDIIGVRLDVEGVWKRCKGHS